MLAMSCGFRNASGLRPPERPPPTGSGMPSTTMSGSLLPVIDVWPRTRICAEPPGSLAATICTPGIFAWISSSGVTTRPLLNVALSTAATEPVTFRRSCVAGL
jgi:hypothetical protein